MTGRQRGGVKDESLRNGFVGSKSLSENASQSARRFQRVRPSTDQSHELSTTTADWRRRKGHAELAWLAA